MIVGLTGGIGSGKSLVSAQLEALGATIIDCDIISRKVADNPKTIDEIQRAFGAQFFENGKLNRALLRNEIFKDKEQRAKLESIMHPKIISYARELLEREKNAPLVVLVAPLLFEMNMQGMVDIVCTVSAPKEERIKRVIARDNVPKEQVCAILAAQLTDAQREARANEIIINTNRKDCEAQVEVLFERLKLRL